jgi:hypothetical protein
MQYRGYAYRVRSRGGPDRWRWQVVQDPHGQQVVGLILKGETIGPRRQAVEEAERHIRMFIQKKHRAELVAPATPASPIT